MTETSKRRFVRAVLVVALLASTWVNATSGPAAADGNEAPGNPPVFRSLSAGSAHTCAIVTDGSVRCWGQNDRGQLGQGDTEARGDEPGEMGGNLPSVDLGTGRTATAISTGYAHTCALLDDGSVKCWGGNFEGALGIGETGDRGDQPGEMGDALPAVDLGAGRTATAISAGTLHTCAILDNASVKCWGFNQDGQLGLGTGERGVGDQPGDMGDGLPPVNLGAGGQPDAATPVAVTAGGEHTCVLFASASVKCWGSGFYGQLGRGDTTTVGDGPTEMGTNLSFVPLAGQVAAISAGIQHTCALLVDATVKCWGRNQFGELGQGDTANRGDAGGEMANNLHRVELGAGQEPTAISAGGQHSCVLLADASLKCWGRGRSGQLGLGDGDSRGDDPGEMGNDLPAVDLGTARTTTAVTTGVEHTCATLDDGSLRCWGFNVLGGLGLGDDENRGDQPGEMGDDLPPVGRDALIGLTVELSADEVSVFTGQDIHYHLALVNTGNTTLRDVMLVDPGVGDCAGAVADLVPGSPTSLDCTAPTTSADQGTISLTATVDSDLTGPVDSNPVDVEVAADRQPDLSLKKVGGTLVGDDLYGTDPAAPDQSVTVGRARGGRVAFVARVENDGDSSARYRFRRLGTDAGLTVRYFVGATDVTAAVVGRTFLSGPVGPGGSTSIRVEVSVSPTASRQVPHHVTLRARSAAPNPQVDTARGTVLVFR